MYDYFKKIQWPIDRLPKIDVDGVVLLSLNKEYSQRMNELFVDFRVNLYANTWPINIGNSSIVPPQIAISKFQADTGGPLNIQIAVVVPEGMGDVPGFGSDIYTVSNLLSLGNSADEYVTYHFDSTDFPSLPNEVQIEGFICVSNVAKFLAAYPSFFMNPDFGDRAYAVLFPTTVSMFTGHRVSSIACRNTLPLLCQNPDAKYLPVSSPVSGDVKLVEGSNCVISVQPSTNTVVVSAQINANVPSGESNCGKWGEKISVASVSCISDTLCNEVVYSISGVSPDDAGNIQIQAEAPLAVNSLTKDTVPDPFKPILTSSEFSSIIRVIYVGLPQGQNNSSVFDCDAV